MIQPLQWAIKPDVAFNEVKDKWKDKRDQKCITLEPCIIDETPGMASVSNKLFKTDSLGKNFIMR